MRASRFLLAASLALSAMQAAALASVPCDPSKPLPELMAEYESHYDRYQYLGIDAEHEPMDKCLLTISEKVFPSKEELDPIMRSYLHDNDVKWAAARPRFDRLAASYVERFPAIVARAKASPSAVAELCSDLQAKWENLYLAEYLAKGRNEVREIRNQGELLELALAVAYYATGRFSISSDPSRFLSIGSKILDWVAAGALISGLRDTPSERRVAPVLPAPAKMCPFRQAIKDESEVTQEREQAVRDERQAALDLGVGLGALGALTVVQDVGLLARFGRFGGIYGVIATGAATYGISRYTHSLREKAAHDSLRENLIRKTDDLVYSLGKRPIDQATLLSRSNALIAAAFDFESYVHLAIATPYLELRKNIDEIRARKSGAERDSAEREENQAFIRKNREKLDSGALGVDPLARRYVAWNLWLNDFGLSQIDPLDYDRDSSALFEASVKGQAVERELREAAGQFQELMREKGLEREVEASGRGREFFHAYLIDQKIQMENAMAYELRNERINDSGERTLLEALSLIHAVSRKIGDAVLSAEADRILAPRLTRFVLTLADYENSVRSELARMGRAS